MSVRTRFAPSPTGFLHIGGARTALFSFLFARRNGGKHLLRIEDTDQERSTPEAVAVIMEGLEWLGLGADEPPLFQSRNRDRHLAVARQLIELGAAYRCYCTREELDAMREEQRAANQKPKYDGRCRRRPPPSDPAATHVIRFITPEEGNIGWQDLIQGEITFANHELDDLVLVRSDGLPTYNLAVVSDDHEMGITHVIRGEDHISNTPRQLHLYRALGWTPPEYAHMPLLHGEDGAKLSKRHGAVSVLQYRDDGFLPQAVNNYLVRLGWSHGEQEIFSMEEMIQLFDVRAVGRSAAIFNTSKLAWLNSHYLRATPAAELAPLVRHHLLAQGVDAERLDPDYLTAVIPSLQPRAKTLVELAQLAGFYFNDPSLPFNPKLLAKHVTAPVMEPFQELRALLANLTEWEEATIEAEFKRIAAPIGMGKLAQPVRIALTGSDVSPGVFEMIRLLGRERVLRRLATAAAAFRSQVTGSAL